ncbi:MAG: efflux RND transporter periplasmic adaptor subunit [Acidobacteria bacterium]|nr:efflux RND transporter periplasmic adaptor subunit [Acidobacteriota bacterium]
MLRQMCRWSAVILAAAAAAACSKGETAQARGRDSATKSVKVELVKKERITRTVELVGTLAAVDQVTISSETDGKVSRILADLGDRVRAGQPLVQIDQEKQQYNVEQQKAALARALAQYGAADPEHLPEIEKTPDVQKASADLRQARQAYDRTNELFKRSLVPQQMLDDAAATLQAKQAGYDLSLQGAKNLRASIQASEASMKLADRQLRDTEIRAPFDGYVEKRLVNLGELVKTQMPVMSVVRIDPLKVVAEIPEKLAPWIHQGQPVELHVDAFPDKTFTGKVSRISPAVNTSTRAFPFEALAPNQDGVLKPGTFARVHIESGKVDDVLSLPAAVLQYRYGVNRVFVIDGDKLTAHELKIGERMGDRVEILTGVNAGDRVAANDIDKLTDGMKVTTDGGKKTEE